MADYGSIRERWTRVVASEDSARGGTIAAPSPAHSDAPPHSPPASGDLDPSRTAAPRSLADGTFIGGGALFEGTLTLRGDFRIDTEFRGELETDGTIIVEPNGSVVGSIRAREVIIRGAVMGNVIAPRQVLVESTGKLHGDIETACLEIQKYAFFQGNTKMSQPQTSRRPGVSNSDAASASALSPTPSNHASA
ncbi:MAG: polymer-forming cytoskeletal protein [Myxococcota bacterium]